MSDLENLRPEELLALARNPSSKCRDAAIARLRAMHSRLANHPDINPPKPVVPRPWRRNEEHKPPPPADPTEAIAMLGKFPADRLMDIVSSVSVYSKAIRAEAAKLVKLKTTGGGEFARKVRIRMENNKDFAEMMN